MVLVLVGLPQSKPQTEPPQTTAATSVSTSASTTSTSYWNKDSYYQPKIHHVTEGLKSKQSARQYLYQFNAFLKYLGLKPNDDSDLLQLLKRQPEEIEEIISEFLTHLREKRHLKAASINLSKSAIVHFFKRNRVKLNKDWISGFVPAEEGYRQDRHYTHDEIKKIIDACPEDRIKVAIHLMASTAMRVGSLTYTQREDMPLVLEYGDLTWLPDHQKYMIMVYNKSKEDRYPTYCTRECALMINKYLDYRRKAGEVITETSPIIREQFDPKDKLAVRSPKKLMESTLTKIIRVAILKAGLKEVLAHQVKQTHGFRKFAITMMNQAGILDTHRRYMTSHAQLGQDRSYVLPTLDALLTEYQKAENLLTIDPEQQLKQENAELKKCQNDYLEQLGELKEDFYELKQFVLNIDSKEMKRKLLDGFVKEACFAYQEEGL